MRVHRQSGTAYLGKDYNDNKETAILAYFILLSLKKSHIRKLRDAFIDVDI
jgi:hypothetical protein